MFRVKTCSKDIQLWLNCAFRVTLVAKSEAKCSMQTSANAEAHCVKVVGLLCLCGWTSDSADAMESCVLCGWGSTEAEYCLGMAWRWTSTYHVCWSKRLGFRGVGWVWLRWCSVKISKYGPEKIHWRCAPLLECYSLSQVVGSGGID